MMMPGLIVFLKRIVQRIVYVLPGALQLWLPFSVRRKQTRILSLFDQVPNIPKKKNRILFWMLGGLPLMSELESTVATALSLRGYDVHGIICDGAMRACVRREIQQKQTVEQWQRLCAGCHEDVGTVLKGFGLSCSSLGCYVPEADRRKFWEDAQSYSWETLDELRYKDVLLGTNARSGIIRYLQGANVKGSEHVVREYVYSTLVSAAAAYRALDELKPDHVYMSHGFYADWGPALRMAISKGVPVTVWSPTYLTARFYFGHVTDPQRIDVHAISRPAWDAARAAGLNPLQDQRLKQFEVSRYKKKVSFDMQRLSEYSGDTEALKKQYGPKTAKPTWGIFAHVSWDAVFETAPMAYGSYEDWLSETLKLAVEDNRVHWLLKIHPAEAWIRPERSVHRMIEEKFGTLPEHVRVIPAEVELNPLDFYNIIEGGITVYGTAGLELAYMQAKPVILAGEAHYGRKGFTHDGLAPEKYTQLLKSAYELGPLSQEQQKLARIYAYSYFIQRQVPLPVVKDAKSSWWRFQMSLREKLLPGKDCFMDFICQRILDGKDFEMSEDLVARAEALGW